MDPTKIAELEAATAAAKSAAEAAGGTDETLNKALQDAETALQQAKTPSNDSITQAIETEKTRGQRTEAEKAAYSLKKTADRARELGLDVAEVLGVKPAADISLDEDDNKPVTMGDLKRLQAAQASQTALQMAEAIEDSQERELTKLYLKRVVPSGNPSEDLRFARLAVNSEKNGQILQELDRSKKPPAHGSGTGTPARQDGNESFVPTEHERRLMGKPFNLSKEQVLAARPKS